MPELTDEDNKEAMLKAFELFYLCLSYGPCNDCIFFDRYLPEDQHPCLIGCPNSWPLFDTEFKNGLKNRKVVLDILRKKEEKNDIRR